MGLLSSIFGAATGGAIQGPITVEKVKVIDEITTIDGIKRLETIDKINDVNIQSLPCPKVNDRSITNSWTVAKIGAALITTAATVEAFRAANERYKIAKRYWRLAQDEWDFFAANYKPLELKELAELDLMPPDAPDYISSVDGHTKAINPIFANIAKQQKSLMDKYCICDSTSNAIRFEVMKSTLVGDTTNFARKYADHISDTRDDVRWARRVAAANRGRSLLSESAKFASKAAGYYGDYSNAMSGLAAGANYGLNYLEQRNPTRYNSWSDPRVNNRLNGLTQNPYPQIADTTVGTPPSPVMGADVIPYGGVSMGGAGIAGVEPQITG